MRMRLGAALAALALLGSPGCDETGGPGNDPSLSSLVPSAGALRPAFTPSNTVYLLVVPGGTDTLTFVPTATDPGVKSIALSQDNVYRSLVSSGAATPALTVPAEGLTSVFALKVTARDGLAERNYQVTVKRESVLCGTAELAWSQGGPSLPAEPNEPPTCATVPAQYAVNGTTGLPVFTYVVNTPPPDTDRIQTAINGCTSGSVHLALGSSGNVAFVSGPLSLKSAVTLVVDQGVTLFASQNPRDYDKVQNTPSCGMTMPSSSGCKAFITATSTTGAGIAGKGVIDGLGGEPMFGSSNTWWDMAELASQAKTNFSNPRLIDVNSSPGSAPGFTLHNITLRNSPKFHVGLGSDNFMVWGVTIQTPSRKTNSVGKALSAAYAHNTDGIDPYDAHNGYIVYSTITTGDDQIALKCGSGGCGNITIAHNRFGTGHGMSVGSETNSGLDGLYVYDLAIDGLLPNGGVGNGSLNGIRIKSDRSCGGLVQNVTYDDVCMRGLANPILLNPNYDKNATGSAIPTFQGVTIKNTRHVDCAASPATQNAKVTLNGFDATHPSTATLDSVMVDGIAAADVVAQYATVTLGSGPVNFTPAATSDVTVTDQRNGSGTYNNCAGKFVALPAPQ